MNVKYKMLNTKACRQIERIEKDHRSSKHKKIGVTISDKTEFRKRTIDNTRHHKVKRALLGKSFKTAPRGYEESRASAGLLFQFPKHHELSTLMNFNL